MACHHKFKNNLNLSNLDYSPETLIIGTFNPSWPDKNYAKWFYGRTKENHFWDVLPKVYGEESLINADPVDWKNFCKRHLIGITDLIECINDADENNQEHIKILSTYSDSNIEKHFTDFSTEHIFNILNNKNNIKNIYLTRKGKGKLFGKLWLLIKKCCNNNSKTEELLTPSDYARIQFYKAKKLKQTDSKNTVEFIIEDWKSKWHNIN